MRSGRLLSRFNPRLIRSERAVSINRNHWNSVIPKVLGWKEPVIPLSTVWQTEQKCDLGEILNHRHSQSLALPASQFCCSYGSYECSDHIEIHVRAIALLPISPSRLHSLLLVPLNPPSKHQPRRASIASFSMARFIERTETD